MIAWKKLPPRVNLGSDSRAPYGGELISGHKEVICIGMSSDSTSTARNHLNYFVLEVMSSSIAREMAACAVHFPQLIMVQCDRRRGGRLVLPI